MKKYLLAVGIGAGIGTAAAYTECDFTCMAAHSLCSTYGDSSAICIDARQDCQVCRNEQAF